MLILRNLLCIFVLSFNALIAQSADWISPIEIKYKNQYPEIYSKYTKARDLNDSWGGRQSVLVESDQILREILNLEPDFAPAYREYGRLFIKSGYINTVGDVSSFKKGSLGPAEQSILRSIEIEPDYADAYVLLGHLYTKMKVFSEAEIALNKAEEIGTEIPWLDLNWADLLNLQGKKEEAFSRFNKVLAEKTSNKGAYSKALGGVTAYYESKGDLENAKKAYQNHLKFDSNSAWNWGNYASFLLYVYGDVDGAIENSEKALSIMNYGMARFTLACALYTKWALLSETDKTKSNSYFERAIALEPDIGEVIGITVKYKTTKQTAHKLIEYQKKQTK